LIPSEAKETLKGKEKKKEEIRSQEDITEEEGL